MFMRRVAVGSLVSQPAGQPFVFALIDMCVELGEAAACLVLAWLV